MLDHKIVQGLKDRYSHIHPLLFQRSLERAKSNGDLFDILDTVPDRFPIVWDESSSRWVTTDDLLQSKDFSLGESRKDR
jgi:hypothetical protein